MDFPLYHREEFPIVDSEATILVTPGEPCSAIYLYSS